MNGQPAIEVLDYQMRGSAQYLRNLMEYIKAPYKDVFLEKPIKIDIKWIFAATNSLPIIKDGSFVVHGVIPTIKYVCRKYNREDLIGKTPADAAKIQQMLIRIMQWKNTMIMDTLPKSQSVVTNPEQKTYLMRIAYEQPTRKKFLIQANRMLQNNDWALGYFTILDIFLYELCFRTTGYFPEIIDEYPALLVDFFKRFNQIQELQQYFNGDRMMFNLSLCSAVIKWQGDQRFH